MKTAIAILLAAIGLALVSGTTAENKRLHYDFSKVDRFIENNSGLYRNQIVVLVSQDGKLIYKKEVGLDDQSMKPIASASKWLSAAVIMTLVDDGKISLNDSIGRFLPIFTSHRKGNITVRQLFSHTSGLRGDQNEKFEYRRNITLAQAVDSIAILTPLLHKPGSTFNYGGTGMQIGGRIAEIVSGKSWQQLVDEKIGKPCGMHVSFGSTQNPIIAGGARTSARDYLHFLEMVINKGTYNGRRVISEKSITMMLSDQTTGAVIEGTPYPRNPFSAFPKKDVRYGMGNWLDVTDEHENVFESSSPGLFGTHPWQDSKHRIAGIIFTVTRPKISNQSSLEIRKMIRDIVEK